jgi:hypothetical protein
MSVQDLPLRKISNLCLAELVPHPIDALVEHCIAKFCCTELVPSAAQLMKELRLCNKCRPPEWKR